MQQIELPGLAPPAPPDIRAVSASVERFALARDPMVDIALAGHAPVYLGVSGGKDSQALAYRARYGLGGAGLTEREAPEGALAYDIGDLRVITSFTAHVPVPQGWRVLISSAEVDESIDPETTAWLIRA